MDSTYAYMHSKSTFQVPCKNGLSFGHILTLTMFQYAFPFFFSLCELFKHNAKHLERNSASYLEGTLFSWVFETLHLGTLQL
jgi:hypothetical protein